MQACTDEARRFPRTMDQRFWRARYSWDAPHGGPVSHRIGGYHPVVITQPPLLILGDPARAASSGGSSAYWE